MDANNRQHRSGAEKPYTLAQLDRLARDQRSGPQWRVIQRLITTARQALEESEERGWRITELETKLRDAQEGEGAKVIVAVESDGHVTIRHDSGASVKVVTLLPWQDMEDELAAMLRFSPWCKTWLEGHLKTALPHYVSEPNKVTPADIERLLQWQQRMQVMEMVKKLEALTAEAKS